MPTGVPVHYFKAKQSDQFFSRKPLYAHKQMQTQCIEWLAHVFGVEIRHQLNSASEPSVAGQRPDGYHAPSKTVVYVDGCRFHGHGGCIANPESKFVDGDPILKRKRDYAIREKLRERGYKVLEIKECTWMKMKSDNFRASQISPDFVASKLKRSQVCSDKGADEEYDYDPTLLEFINKHFSLPKHGRMDESALIREIWRGSFFGVIVCDVKVPEHLREHFADFEPIFKNVEVGAKDLSEHMAEFLQG